MKAVLGAMVACFGLSATAGAACPPQTDNGVSYLFTLPMLHRDFHDGLLAILSDAPAVVSVGIPACAAAPIIVNPAPGMPVVLPICAAAQFRGTGPTPGFDISVTRLDSAVATLHVVAKSQSSPDQSDDAFLVLPRERLGSSYWTMGLRALIGGPLGTGSRWAAVAPEPLELNYENCLGAAVPVTMGASEVQSENCEPGPPNVNDQATGFRLFSTGGQVFSLLSGSTCAENPDGVAACDTLIEMMPPDSWAGDEYIVTEFHKHHQSTIPGDLVRLMATSSAVTIQVVPALGGMVAPNTDFGHACLSTTTVTLAAAGDFCDLHIARGARLKAATGQSFLVGQFAKAQDETGSGDPTFVLVAPTARLRCAHRFISFAGYPYSLSATEEEGSFVNIVAPSASIDSVELDGSTLLSGVTCLDRVRFDFPSPITESWTRCRLMDPGPAGSEHRIESGAVPVGAYVYGQRQYGAYSYSSGIGF